MERQIAIHSIAISGLTIEQIFDGRVRRIADRHICMRFTSAPNSDLLYICTKRILDHRRMKLWKATRAELAVALENEKEK